jgi:hypothetical protein
VYIRWTRSGVPSRTLAIGILADLLEDAPDRVFDPAVVGVPLAVVLPTPGPRDVVDGDARLTDLRLDLVDEPADVRGQVGRAGHGRGMVRRWTWAWFRQSPTQMEG